MSLRGRRLLRLLEIRRIYEDAERARLQSVHAAVSTVETAIAAQQQAIVDSAGLTASALRSGERSEWLFAETQSEVAERNCAGLAPLLHARRAEIAPATAGFLDARREHKQMQQLIAESKEQQRLIDERKAQAAADDWFLAQRYRKPR